MKGVFRDLAGQRIGEWSVLRRAPAYVTPGGQVVTCWWCRCSCGAERAVRASALVTAAGVPGSSRRCVACGRRENARRSRQDLSVHLPSGRTVAEVAAGAGLPLDTVYARWRRGWQEADLGLPVGQYAGGGTGRGHAARVLPAATRSDVARRTA